MSHAFNQSSTTEPLDHVSAEVKEMFSKENLSWRKLAELDGAQGKGSYRQNFLARLAKAQRTLQKFGYRIRIEKIS